MDTEKEKSAKLDINIKTLAISISLLIFAAAVYFIWGGGEFTPSTGDNSDSILVSSGFKIDIEYTLKPGAFSDDEGFYLCTNDGVKRFDTNGKTKYDAPMSLLAPVFVNSGQYTAVGQYKGNEFHVFGPKGKIFSQSFNNEIVSFDVYSNGCSSVTLNATGGGYTVHLYDENGNAFGRYLNFLDKNNYPVSIAMTDDKKIIAVSLLDISNLEMSSYISAYYIDEVNSANFTDGLFATFQRSEKQIISNLEFVGNKLFYVTDSSYGMYEIGSNNQMNLKWFRDVNNQILFTKPVSESVICVVLGEAFTNKTGEKQGSVLLVNSDGSEAGRFSDIQPVSYISCGRGSVIIGGGGTGRKFAAISDKGKLLWEYSSISDVYELLMLEKTDKAVLVSATGIAEMGRGKAAEGSDYGELFEYEQEIIK